MAENEKGRSSMPWTEYSGLTPKQKMKKFAQALFGAYRRDQFADPDTFILQVGALFEQYDEHVVARCVDIRNYDCLQRRHDWPPSMKEISEALEEQAAKFAAALKAQYAPKPVPRPYFQRERFPGYRANLHVLKEAPQYDGIRALVESGEVSEYDYRVDERGIWIALNIFLDRSGYRSPGVKPLSAQFAEVGQREIDAAKGAL